MILCEGINTLYGQNLSTHYTYSSSYGIPSSFPQYFGVCPLIQKSICKVRHWCWIRAPGSQSPKAFIVRSSSSKTERAGSCIVLFYSTWAFNILYSSIHIHIHTSTFFLCQSAYYLTFTVQWTQQKWVWVAQGCSGQQNGAASKPSTFQLVKLLYLLSHSPPEVFNGVKVRTLWGPSKFFHVKLIQLCFYGPCCVTWSQSLWNRKGVFPKLYLQSWKLRIGHRILVR